MKTPHRIMHDALTPEEWKNFLRMQDIRKVSSCNMQKAYHILCYGFIWDDDKVKDREYWVDIWDRLYLEGK